MDPETDIRSRFSWTPELIVLGPGGVKGFLELGALLVLEKHGWLDEVHTFVGVSVGAIIGLLLTCGYRVSEIIAEAADTNIFQDLSTVSLADIRGNVGLVSNEPIKKKIREQIIEVYGHVPTLHQLYLYTGIRFVAVSHNLDKEQVEYLSYETEPDMSCIDAVMLSMNIPLLFYKLKYKGCVYIDGAFGNPYPVDHYDDGETQILGIYIRSTSPQEKEPTDSSTTMYVHKTIQATMNELRRRIIEMTSSRCRHIELKSPTVDSTGLSVNADLKADMILSGYRIASEFIQGCLKETSSSASQESPT
jgi:predicted acylesterase/phospholipase RssA